MQFDFLRRHEQDAFIETPGLTLQFNHRLKIAVLFSADPDTHDDSYDALEAHLKKRGYILQIIVASRGMPYPTPPNREI